MERPPLLSQLSYDGFKTNLQTLLGGFVINRCSLCRDVGPLYPTAWVIAWYIVTHTELVMLFRVIYNVFPAFAH